MKKLAIIPARGGSKRIPRKNIKDFLGKPIISYSIAAAIESRLFDEVMVSTDDVEIAKIAKQYGASVPFMRSNETANDNATLAEVVDEVLKGYEHKFEYFCCILPTAPLITIKSLNDAFKLMIEQNFETVRPVVQFSYPIQRAQQIDTRGEVKMFDDKYINSRTQDLQPAYFDAGQFYWGRSEKGLSATNRGAIVVDEIQSQDIDNDTDWILAELKYKLRK